LKSRRETVETECKPEVLTLTLVSACCAWLLGIYIGRNWSLGSPYLWLIVPLLFVALWLLRKRRSERFAVMLGLLTILGVLRVDSVLPRMDAGTVAYHNNRLVRLTGTVVGRPDVRDTTVQFTVEAEELQVDSEILPMHGKVLISTAIYPRFEYGDRLQAIGYMQEPPISDDSSYRDFLARRNTFSLMSYPKLQLLERGQGKSFAAALYAIREHARSVIDRILPYPEAALLSGILLGAYHALPEKLRDSFNATGTSHIIVISGFNITILAIVMLRVSNQWLNRHKAVWISIAGIMFYALLVGADAAVMRAAFMGSMILLAVLVGRASDALTSLALATLVMSAWSPLILWDVSFQLSAGATLGLILFASSLYQYAHHTMAGSDRSRFALPLIKDTVIATLAAQVFTLPLLLYYFRRFSLVMPAANILVLPVQPSLMAGGAIALLAGSVWLPAGQVIGWAAWLFLTYTIRIVELLASLPFASVEIGRLPEALLWVYFGTVFAILWVTKQGGQKRRELWQAATRHLSATAVIVSLLLICLVVWAAVFSLSDGQLHVRFLNVGQGDSALITLPSGQQVLIDGGPSPTGLLSELGRAMPFWDRNIELVILSHPDEDHLMGLVGLLERYQFDRVIDPIADTESDLYLRWQQLLTENNTPVQQAYAGMSVDLGDGAYLEVLHPQPGLLAQDVTDVNNASTVLRLVYGQVSFLFTGDLEEEGEHTLLQSGHSLDSTVLKVSHHGAKEATTDHFLQAVNPQMAVISVGSNRFGHPAQETLARLADVPVLRTDRTGTVDVRTDGAICWADKSP
jgi:competence protein ComEC